MEKKILVLCFLVLGLTLYNYSNFDNKGVVFLIVLLCFIVICFAGAKIRYPTDDDNFHLVEKEKDKLESFDGIFNFKKDGFFVTKNKITDFIKWIEIIEVNSFNIPLQYHERQSGIEIITEMKSYEFIDRQTPGIDKLGNQLCENLPSWKLDSPTIRVNNHGLEKTNLYQRK